MRLLAQFSPAVSDLVFLEVSTFATKVGIAPNRWDAGLGVGGGGGGGLGWGEVCWVGWMLA